MAVNFHATRAEAGRASTDLGQKEKGRGRMAQQQPFPMSLFPSHLHSLLPPSAASLPPYWVCGGSPAHQPTSPLAQWGVRRDPNLTPFYRDKQRRKWKTATPRNTISLAPALLICRLIHYPPLPEPQRHWRGDQPAPDPYTIFYFSQGCSSLFTKSDAPGYKARKTRDGCIPTHEHNAALRVPYKWETVSKNSLRWGAFGCMCFACGQDTAWQIIHKRKPPREYCWHSKKRLDTCI